MSIEKMSILQAAHIALFSPAKSSRAKHAAVSACAVHEGLKHKFQMEDVNLADPRLAPQTREVFAVLLQRFALYLDRSQNGLDDPYEMRQRAHAVGMDLKSTWLRLFASDYSHEVGAAGSDMAPLSQGGFDALDMHRLGQPCACAALQ